MPRSESSTTGQPWAWVPSLYFSQGIPYVAVMTLSGVLYKNLDVSNAQIAFYTSWLNFPWVIKPLWSPLIDAWRTKRGWITSLQLVMGGGLGAVALTLPAPFFVQATLVIFWLLAFTSATHDIAADGFYLLALKRPQQAAFVGVRSTFFRLAMIAGQGGLIYLAGTWFEASGSYRQAWVGVFTVLAGGFTLVAVYHRWALPRPAADGPVAARVDWATWWTVMAAFFRRSGILRVLGFLLLYRFAEAQLLNVVRLFLLDDRAAGGLALSNQQLGLYYGTYGVIALTVGGLIGGYLVSRHGLRRLLWPMVAAMHVPNAVFIALAVVRPTEPIWVAGAVVAEQLGYGFGFTAYMVYMMMVADGPHKTAHYALCTGFMALGMMLPGMFAGALQETIGYPAFFGWVLACALPSVIASALIKIEADFGRT